MFSWNCGKQFCYPAKLLSIKIHFFSLIFDSNVHKSTIFSKLLFAKSSIEHLERIFKNTLGNLPWRIRPVFLQRTSKKLSIHTFSKKYIQYARRKITSETIWFPSKLNLLCSESDSSHHRKHVFHVNIFISDPFFTNCWRKACSAVLLIFM